MGEKSKSQQAKEDAKKGHARYRVHSVAQMSSARRPNCVLLELDGVHSNGRKINAKIAGAKQTSGS